MVDRSFARRCGFCLSGILKSQSGRASCRTHIESHAVLTASRVVFACLAGLVKEQFIMKKVKASLIATGVGAALAMALSGPVLAGNGDGPMHHDNSAGNAVHGIEDSAVATDHASATSVELGDVSVGVYSASTALNGTVQNNGSEGIH